MRFALTWCSIRSSWFPSAAFVSSAQPAPSSVKEGDSAGESGRLYLAVIHPMMWQSLVSMRFGCVSESGAREHHARWYYDHVQAMRLWEQRLAEGPG